MSRSSEATKIPSPMARIVEMMRGDDKSGITETITNIGMALSAAGVMLSAAPGAVTSLGQLAVDPRLPALMQEGAKGFQQGIA